MHQGQKGLGTGTRVKIYRRGLWEYQKCKVWIHPTRAGCWEAEQCQQLLIGMPAADLSLPTTASFPTTPPQGTKQKHLQEVPQGSNPDILGQVMASAEGLYKTELRETTQTTSRTWRKVIPVGEKKKAKCPFTQLHFSPCSSKSECLHLACLLGGPWNELGTVLSMEIV